MRTGAVVGACAGGGAVFTGDALFAGAGRVVTLVVFGFGADGGGVTLVVFGAAGGGVTVVVFATAGGVTVVGFWTAGGVNVGDADVAGAGGGVTGAVVVVIGAGGSAPGTLFPRAAEVIRAAGAGAADPMRSPTGRTVAPNQYR